MGSLVTRVLVAAGAILVVFLGLTVAALDLSFRSAAERTTRDRLQVQVFALMAAAEFPEGIGLVMPEQLPEPRLAHPGSGLYAQILDAAGTLLWRSPSAVGLAFPRPHVMNPAEAEFRREPLADGAEVFRIGFTVVWDSGVEGASPRTYHFLVAESLESYLAQVSRFRANLLWWFATLFAALIIAQLIILRRMMRPLRSIATEVASIEAGRQDLVTAEYPRELARLAGNLNALLRNERRHLERYRNTLGDLAHSLKTPLAVIRVALEERPDPARDHAIGTQIERMNEIVRYQLQRASAVGTETFGRAIRVAPAARELVQALEKVYSSRQLQITLDLDEDAVFLGSRGDLLEMLGNILDNACKWAKTSIQFAVNSIEERGLEIKVEDDGPDIPESLRDGMLKRGTRADETVDGQGIGLAMVYDIVQQHGGTLELSTSGQGGLKVTVRFCDNPVQ